MMQREMGKGGDALVVCSDKSLGIGITIWDVDTGDHLLHIPTCASPSHGLLCLRKQFLVASQIHRQGSVGGGAIFIWALNKPQLPLRSYPVEAIVPLSCTKDGIYLAGGALSGNAYLWEIPSVIELVQAGVKFKVRDRNKYGLHNLTFKDGVMTTPQRFVSEDSESLYRNLIAFEQCDPSKDFKVTSYAKLADDLINTSQDVEFLKHQQILGLYLSDEDASSFFNRLYSDASVRAFLYSDLYREVNAYCKRPWNRWRALLKRDYFGNPWTILSLNAAILILIFALLETLYSMLSYYQRAS